MSKVVKKKTVPSSIEAAFAAARGQKQERPEQQRTAKAAKATTTGTVTVDKPTIDAIRMLVDYSYKDAKSCAEHGGDIRPFQSAQTLKHWLETIT